MLNQVNKKVPHKKIIQEIVSYQQAKRKQFLEEMFTLLDEARAIVSPRKPKNKK